MNIQKINISELKVAEYNPRIDLRPGDEKYEQIKKSISEFGYVDPIVVNKDMTVIGGHQRLKILKELGYGDLSEKDIDALFKDIDLNNDSVISFNEFLHIMKKMTSKGKKKKSKK